MGTSGCAGILIIVGKTARRAALATGCVLRHIHQCQNVARYLLNSPSTGVNVIRRVFQIRALGDDFDLAVVQIARPTRCDSSPESGPAHGLAGSVIPALGT